MKLDDFLIQLVKYCSTKSTPTPTPTSTPTVATSPIEPTNTSAIPVETSQNTTQKTVDVKIAGFA